MSLTCFTRDRAVSRYLDGELPVADLDRLRAHLQACLRCASRLEAFGHVDGLVSGLRAPLPASTRPAPSRLLLAVAAAAALVASLAANLLLPSEPLTPPDAVFTVPAAPSQALSGLYTRLAGPGVVPR